MQIHETTQDHVTVLAPAGRIDTTTSPALEDAVRRLLDARTPAVLVDLAGVDYISSAGLRVFLVLAKRMREMNGRVVLCCLEQPVHQVFKLAGFLPLFTVEPTRDAAMTRLLSPP